MPEFIAFGTREGRRERDFEAFERGYIAAALFTTSDSEGDNPDWVNADALTDEALAGLRKAARFFLGLSGVAEAMTEAEESGAMERERIGNNAWYVSQGHGVGFFDDCKPGEHPACLVALDKAAHDGPLVYLTAEGGEVVLDGMERCHA